MINLLSQSGHQGYGIKEYVLDTIADLDDLPITDKAGSTAFIISTSQVYMINSGGEWKEVLENIEGGKLPVKGEDYFTEQEISEIKQEISNELKPDLDAIKNDTKTALETAEQKISEIKQKISNELKPDLDTVKNNAQTALETAKQAKTIARGRATGYVFDTLEDLDIALTDETFVTSLVLGDNLYIRATDVPDYWWDGTQKQQLEAEKPDLSGLIEDVRINGKSIVSLGVANIPYSTKYGEAGIVSVDQNKGLTILDDKTGLISITGAKFADIYQRINPSYSNKANYQPIVLSALDYAVKSAMCDGKGAAWTDTEKIGAWKRQAIIKTTMDEVAVAGAQYYLGEQTAVSIVLPDGAEVGQMITVCWYNGATAATLSITGTMLNFDYTPSANTRSEINALWDGTYWAVLWNEIAVPSKVTA